MCVRGGLGGLSGCAGLLMPPSFPWMGFRQESDMNKLAFSKHHSGCSMTNGIGWAWTKRGSQEKS